MWAEFLSYYMALREINSQIMTPEERLKVFEVRDTASFTFMPDGKLLKSRIRQFPDLPRRLTDVIIARRVGSRITRGELRTIKLILNSLEEELKRWEVNYLLLKITP